MKLVILCYERMSNLSIILFLRLYFWQIKKYKNLIFFYRYTRKNLLLNYLNNMIVMIIYTNWFSFIFMIMPNYFLLSSSYYNASNNDTDAFLITGKASVFFRHASYVLHLWNRFHRKFSNSSNFIAFAKEQMWEYKHNKHKVTVTSMFRYCSLFF